MVSDEGSGQNLSSRENLDVSLAAIPLHSTNLLTVLDADGVIHYESPSIERLYGFDQDTLVGESVAEYFHPADRESVVAAFESLVTSEGYTETAVEYRHERADGSYCWVESVAGSNPMPDGGYVVNTREITERKEREAELERQNERLDAFASVLSHDLRNPLNVAELRLDLAMRDGETDHLGDVRKAHRRIETLIDDLLAVARSSQKPRATEPVDLTSLCEECWEYVATDDATLAVAVDRPVVADRSRLQQVVENLMRNAVNHNPGPVSVTVGTLSDGNGFYVEDDGAGIPVESRGDVFETGYTTTSNGTGLGLAIVAEIADAHGWDLALTESESGGLRVEFADVDIR